MADLIFVPDPQDKRSHQILNMDNVIQVEFYDRVVNYVEKATGRQLSPDQADQEFNLEEDQSDVLTQILQRVVRITLPVVVLDQDAPFGPPRHELAEIIFVGLAAEAIEAQLVARRPRPAHAQYEVRS